MRILIVAACLAVMTGCVSYQAPSYISTADTADRLAATETKYSVELASVAEGDNGSIMCRGAGAITVGEGLRYADYIINALSQDLKNAKAFSPGSDNEIQASYSKIDFQSSLGAANWYIFGTYTLGSESVSIETTYNDRSSFSGNTACRNMALYFQKAVDSHLHQLYSSRIFKVSKRAPLDRQGRSLEDRLAELERAHADGLITSDELEVGRRAAIEGR